MKFCAFLLGFLVCAGCSSTEKDSDPYATVTGFCAAWGKAACTPAAVSACAGVAAATAALTDTCVEKQQMFCEGLVPEAGYSSALAKGCLGAVQQAYSHANGKLSATEIATVRHRGAPCNQLIKGTQHQGASCTTDDDCDTVNKYQCLMKAGVGTCEIPVPADNGTPCAAPAASCNAGFYCDGDNCVQSKLVDAKCMANYECGAGLTCNMDADAGTSTGKCVMPVNPAHCSQDQDCSSSVCDIAVGSSTGLCVSLITLSPTEGICEDL